ncbi:MAG: 3-deoxy-manno-octulosonate cytidylyltransferase [Bacteroidota bacterium]
MSQFLGIIPARYASSRFPGKPLAQLGNKPMIQWVYESASQLFDHLVVATDDHRIFQAVEEFGGKAIMTSPNHRSGTDRCAEAYHLYRDQTGKEFSHIVNIQGDEPLIKKEQLKILMDCFQIPGTRIATLIQPLQNRDEFGNPNVVKVVVDKTNRALYFSRAPIPFRRDLAPDNQIDKQTYYTHVGLYAFRSEVLDQVVKLPPSDLELTESLEQLRWMENGFPIQTSITHLPSIGVDTPEDLERISLQI